MSKKEIQHRRKGNSKDNSPAPELESYLSPEWKCVIKDSDILEAVSIGTAFVI